MGVTGPFRVMILERWSGRRSRGASCTTVPRQRSWASMGAVRLLLIALGLYIVYRLFRHRSDGSELFRYGSDGSGAFPNEMGGRTRMSASAAGAHPSRRSLLSGNRASVTLRGFPLSTLRVLGCAPDAPADGCARHPAHPSKPSTRSNAPGRTRTYGATTNRNRLCAKKLGGGMT